jgi:hypothetical protein
VPETGELFPVPADAAPAWFLERGVERWRRAEAARREAPLAVLDGDPLKGLWWGWVYPGEGWTTPDEAHAFYRPRFLRGELAFPDVYVHLDADEATLRARRAGDPTRARRNFERHLRVVAPLRRYFAALGALAPGLVRVLPSGSVDERAAAVRALVRGAPAHAAAHAAAHATSPAALLDGIVAWLRATPA